MSNGLNKVQLIGNLGADPELRVTQGGTSVLNMRLACSETYLDKAGEKQTKTEWVSCVLWGKRGEALHRFMSKGKQLYLEGRLQTSSYEDRDGVKRHKTEVNVSEVILLGGGGEREQRPERQDPSDPPKKDKNTTYYDSDGVPITDDDPMGDLPF